MTRLSKIMSMEDEKKIYGHYEPYLQRRRQTATTRRLNLLRAMVSPCVSPVRNMSISMTRTVNVVFVRIAYNYELVPAGQTMCVSLAAALRDVNGASV